MTNDYIKTKLKLQKMPTLDHYSNILEILISMQSNLDEPRMIELFGPRMGAHLFEKLIRVDRNIVNFYSALDKHNRLVLIKHISRL